MSSSAIIENWGKQPPLTIVSISALYFSFLEYTVNMKSFQRTAHKLNYTGHYEHRAIWEGDELTSMT